jgi:hypothetical protein
MRIRSSANTALERPDGFYNDAGFICEFLNVRLAHRPDMFVSEGCRYGYPWPIEIRDVSP